MKGITHFVTGVALASCFPSAVQAGADGNPLYFIIGGVFGLLPDTLDFKGVRFLHKHEMEIIPDPSRPDPALIADAMAGAIRRVHETHRPLSVKVHTSSPGAGLWHRFRITLGVTGNSVTVAYDGVVTTSRQTSTNPPPDPITATITLPCAVTSDYLATSEVDIFEGPSFTFEPLPDGRIIARFIPWHRQWSHSLTVGAAIGVVIGFIGTPLAGLVAAGAHALHALLDQCGYMGTNLLYPFTRRRSAGLQWLRSGNSLANLGVVWTACLLIFWNLSRLTPAHAVPLVKLLLYAAVLPLALAALLRRRFHPSRAAAGPRSR